MRISSLETHADPRGSLTVIAANRDVPFPIARVYYLHGMPAGADRGGHAHRRLAQGLVALAGRFVLRTFDGSEWAERELSDPREMALIPPMTWRELQDFSSDAVCLVLASRPYESEDYIHDLAEFLAELPR